MSKTRGAVRRLGVDASVSPWVLVEAPDEINSLAHCLPSYSKEALMKATFAFPFVGVLIGACGPVHAPLGEADPPILDAAGEPPITCMPPTCFSGAGGGTWHYSRSVPIMGSSAGGQNSYVVLVKVDTASLVTERKMQATGADIRFTSASGSELPWWMEGGMNTSSTRLWVKVDQIPFAGTTIYLDYGNPKASFGGPYANNGQRPFELFDDFAAASLDNARWSMGQRDRLPSQQSGVLHFYEWTSQMANMMEKKRRACRPSREARLLNLI